MAAGNPPFPPHASPGDPGGGTTDDGAGGPMRPAGTLATPPDTERMGGGPRRVGVEIEYAGPDERAVASLIRSLYGGEVREVNPHRFHVAGTAWGDFEAKLDTMYVHPEYPASEQPADIEWGIEEALDAWGRRLDAEARSLIGDAIAGIVPFEVVCPPLPWHDLGALDGLFEGLRALKAYGTGDNPLYGFGLQLNVEIADDGVDYVLRHLRAYLLMSEWLRQQISVDFTRRMLPHVSRFPIDYVLHVVSPAYRPDVRQLITDYVAANPTRNRELDMLPLFMHLDEAHLSSLIHDTRIHARPTFHYRLPNARLSDVHWTAVVEWNRWVEVERLAADPERLEAMQRAFTEWYATPAPQRWLTVLNRWLGL